MVDRKRKAIILFDKIFGEIFFSLLCLFVRKKKIGVINSNIKNLLLIRPGGIGDFLLSVPFFKEIRRNFPNAIITIFLFDRNKECLQLYNEFDRVVIIDSFVELVKYIFSFRNYNLVIDLDQHRKIPSILSMLSGAEVAIGFDKNDKGKAYNYPITYRNDEYEAQSFLNLMEPLGIYKKINEDDLLLVKNKGLKDTVGIYGSAMKKENRLSIFEWKNIIKNIGNDKEFFFFGTGEDRERYDFIHGGLSGYNINRLDGVLSLSESLKTISTLERFVSEDGGCYHIAVCAGVPSVSYWLHGLENMNKWKAPFKKHTGILLK